MPGSQRILNDVRLVRCDVRTQRQYRGERSRQRSRRSTLGNGKCGRGSIAGASSRHCGRSDDASGNNNLDFRSSASAP